jgi:hypothetical protein
VSHLMRHRGTWPLAPCGSRHFCTMTPGEIQQYVVRGVVGAIKEPISSLQASSNLLNLPAIKQLETDPAYANLYKLLQVL